MMHMWRGNLWLLAEIAFMFRTIETDITTHSSKACQTTGACSFHRLDKCSDNQRIAIMDAYFTGNKECDTQNCSANFSNIPENTTRTKLGSSQLSLVDQSCTSTLRCTAVAQRGPQLQRYSVLKYQCVDDKNEINMCNGETKQGHDISLMFGQSLKTNCFCYIRWKTDSTPGVIDFHLLGMSLSTTPCTRLGIYIGENVRTYDCNTTLTPYRYLANGTQTDNDAWVNIQNPPTTSGRIWMQIKGSKNFTISCNTNIITTPGQEDAFSTTENTPAPNTQENGGVIDKVNIAAVAGGVIAAVVVVAIVISGVLLFRRYRKPRTEANNDVPVSESHQTYSGLTVGDNRVYDHIDSPHQDNDYYNVPENSVYQNP